MPFEKGIIEEKENYPHPTSAQSTFAAKAARSAIIKLSNNKTKSHQQYPDQHLQPPRIKLMNNKISNGSNSSHIDKVVESVANATKRLSQQSTQSSSSKRKTENRVGPWRLGRTLGKGSTGRVRLAKHTTTGQLAAVKIIPKNLIETDLDSNSKKVGDKNAKKKKQKFSDNGLPYGIEREIIIMKLISHPNIMALYDVWENKDELYLVLEYVEGGELFDFLINNGRLSERNAVKYFKMIISGVSYCHKFNICHRDLKPENILLDKNGRIKIADFGMAALETQQKLLETSCGSPHYASPEIVTGKNYHGSPSDVWSCGVILFALLTGHLPFDDPVIRQLLIKVQTGKFHMPSNLSPEAKDLIWSMLRVNPNERIKIDNIFNHPLMRKYPDIQTSSDSGRIEDKLAHLDVARPVKHIDLDILDNLRTLWNGIPESHIIRMLQNHDRNPEKMFYYLLESYKLTHQNESKLPNLKKSISKTGLRSSSFKAIPRSTSTIITTIEDKDGKVLKSEVQELKPVAKKSSAKKKVKKVPSRQKIIASTLSNKSISFQKTNREASISTLSIVTMSRNLSIKHDESMINIVKNLRLNNKFSQTNSLIIDNSDISSSRPLTVNPKDLPELPDLKDYKYLMNTIFDTSDSNEDIVKQKKRKSPERKKVQSTIIDDMVILPIDDFAAENATTKSLEMGSRIFTDSSVSKSPKTSNESTLIKNSDLNKSTSKFSKLEQLKQELSISNSKPPNHRIISGIPSIKSSSTRKLSTLLKEGNNLKVKDFNEKHKPLESISYTHKPTNSVDTQTSGSTFNNISDLSYSIHSAVEVKVMTPTQDDLLKLNDSGQNDLIKPNVLPSNVNAKVRQSMFDSSSTFTDPKKSKGLHDSGSSLHTLDGRPDTTSPNSTEITDITGSMYTSVEEQLRSPNPFPEKNVGIRDSMTPTPDTENMFTPVGKPIKPSIPKATIHPYRIPSKAPEKDGVFTSVTTSATSASSPVPHYAGKTNNSTFASAEPTKRKFNWFKKIVSAFSSNQTHVGIRSKDKIVQKDRNKFDFGFSFMKNKQKKDTFAAPTYKPNLFSLEKLIESDMVTRESLLKAIAENQSTKNLVLISKDLTASGYRYRFMVKQLDLTIEAEIIEKVGAEYGFGGCFIKLDKIKGSKKSFYYWCAIIQDLIDDLENTHA